MYLFWRRYTLVQVHYAHETVGRLPVISNVYPKVFEAPAIVPKSVYRGEQLTTSTVISPNMCWENIYMVEVVRSCPEMCRFCLASYMTLPFRAPSSRGSLIPAIERGLEFTPRLGLLGASVTQHPEFEELLDFVAQDQYDHVRMSVSSVRAATVTPKLCRTLHNRGSRSLTVRV